MSLKNLGAIYIAYEKFDTLYDIQKKLDHQKWIEFIEQRRSVYTWFEETETGKEAYSLPGYDSGYKVMALTNYNKQKKYYSTTITFSKEYGLILLLTPRLTLGLLEKLFEMSEFLGAYLLSNGKRLLQESGWIRRR